MAAGNLIILVIIILKLLDFLLTKLLILLLTKMIMITFIYVLVVMIIQTYMKPLTEETLGMIFQQDYLPYLAVLLLSMNKILQKKKFMSVLMQVFM